MKSEWNTSAIANICKVVTDGSHTSPKSVSHGKYMVSVKDFTPYGFDFNGCRQISFADYEKLKSSGCVPQKGDILIGKDGARYFEDIIIYNQDEAPALLSSIAILRCDEEKVIPEYLYYLLKTPSFKKNVKDNYGSGSAIPRIILKDFKRMKVEYPSIEKQRQIVSILHDLDAKIFNNQKVNDNLSDLLQTIYQGQFGKVGLANNCGILADICSYSKDKIEISKLSLDTYYSTENMLPEKSGAVKATSLSTTSQTTACHKGDTLISNIRPYFKKIVYCEDDCGCSTDVLCFKPVHPRYTAYLFSTLYADSFFDFMVAGAKGTKMPRGDKQQIMTYPIVLPSEKDLSEFNSVATPILTQIYSNRTESERLSSIRDTLLPKLILGEIDVSSIQL